MKYKLIINESIADNVLWKKLQDQIGLSFPDTDPMDMLTPWLKKNNINMNDVDRVTKRKTGQTWADYLDDSQKEMKDML
jgi:hypothetical protein